MRSESACTPRLVQITAHLRCVLLDESVTLTDNEKMRLRRALAVIDGGDASPIILDALGDPTLRQLKVAYINHCILREGTVRAASRRLGIDPSAIWRTLKREEGRKTP
jgi:transcriptional regulator of acetoin/glycerol metabolism